MANTWAILPAESESVLLMWIADFEGFKKQVCFFVVFDVGANLFSKNGGIAIGIEEVVLQLESEADMNAEIVKMLYIGGVGIGIECSYFERPGKQYSGFEAYHFQIIGDFYRRLGFEIHIILLPFKRLNGCFVESGEDVLQLRMWLFEKIAPRKGKHGIARENGCIFIPFAIHGGLSTTNGRMV